MSRLTLAFGVALFVVEASVAVAIIESNSESEAPWTTIALAVTAGGAFVLSGLIALTLRPDNRTGLYLAATGYLWFLSALSDSDSEWVFTVGFVFGNLVWVPFTALVLAYPTGRLETRLERAIPRVTAAILVVPAFFAALLDSSPAQNCDSCPNSSIAITDQGGVGAGLDVVATVVGLVLIAVVVGALIRRWRRASPALRRLVWPVVGAGIAALLSIGLVVAADQISQSVGDALQFLFFLAFTAVPLAFLFGVLRTRLARSSVSELVVALQAGTPLRDALARALNDPSLEVAYRLDTGGWIDPSGRGVPDPSESAGRKATTVTRDGQPVAALIHDASLAEEPELIDAITAAAGLSFHNERLQAELRAQYTFLETIADTAPSLLVNIDTDGRILSHNQAAAFAAGYEVADDVRGRHFWDVFTDESEREAIKARFAAAAPDFAAAEYENTFTNAGGEKLVIYWRSAPVHDEDGRTVNIVAGGLDITERTRLEAEKERERAFLNAIAENVPSPLCLIDDDGRLTDKGANASFETALEYRPDEIGGQLFWEEFVDPDEAESVKARIARVVGGEVLGEHDNHWVTSTGRRLVIAWRCTPLPRIDERTLFLISGIDVTERKRREEDVRAGEERLRAAIQGAPAAIIEVGLDDRVRLWNPAAQRIFGWAAEEVIGEVVPVVPPEREAEFRELLERIREGQAYDGFETVRMRRDGTRVDVAISAAPIRDAAGTVIAHMAVFSDISDRKSHEEELRASRARLVAAADEARQQLERNLHDGAQQRLVALSVSLRLAESKLADDPAAAAAIVAGAREELAQALEELRELARGIHPAVLTDRGLGPALESLVHRAGLPVELQAPKERLTPAVEAAAYYVVAEALTNVAKYAGASSAVVRVTQESGVLTVLVTDDGVGGADPGGGTGLRGLADRVAALDGSLTVESPIGQGTSVRATIPLSDVSTEK